MLVCSDISNLLGYSPPDSSVHGTFQTRILECVAIFFSGDIPDPGIKPMSPVSPALQVDSLPTEQLHNIMEPSYVLKIVRKEEDTSDLYQNEIKEVDFKSDYAWGVEF